MGALAALLSLLINNHWFDSALECAKSGKGIDMRMPDWPSAIDAAYDWDRWNCADLRRVFLHGCDGYLFGCGVRLTRVADIAQHNITKRHKKSSSRAQRATMTTGCV